MAPNKKVVKTKQSKTQGATLDELFSFVKDIYSKSSTDKKIEKALDTAKEKWDNTSHVL